MHVRNALITAGFAALVAACGGSSTRQASMPRIDLSGNLPRNATRPNLDASAARPGSEFRVRLDEDLGPGISAPGTIFTARVAQPLLTLDGRVAVPAGSWVHGHVVSVNDAERRVEIAFDKLQTRDGTYQLAATIVSASPWAVTVRPDGAVHEPRTVLLQGKTPSAIGGGPRAPESESDVQLPRGDAIVPFDAELQLRLLRPLVRTAE